MVRRDGYEPIEYSDESLERMQQSNMQLPRRMPPTPPPSEAKNESASDYQPMNFSVEKPSNSASEKQVVAPQIRRTSPDVLPMPPQLSPRVQQVTRYFSARRLACYFGLILSSLVLLGLLIFIIFQLRDNRRSETPS